MRAGGGGTSLQNMALGSGDPQVPNKAGGGERGNEGAQPPAPPGHLRKGGGVPPRGDHRRPREPPPPGFSTTDSTALSPPLLGVQERIFWGISTDALMKMALSRT